jgi:hypothetical protein
MSVGEDPRPGRLSTSTNENHVEKVRAVINGNRHLTVREVAAEVGINIGSYHQIFTEELQMHCVSACTDTMHLKCRTPAHTSLLIHSYLAIHQTSVVPHPTYSPDLAPADFFLFPKVKTSLKGSHFQTIQEIQENACHHTKCIPESIPTMEETLGMVYCQYWGLL